MRILGITADKVLTLDLSAKSAEMTYYILLSIGPFLILAISLFSYLVENQSRLFIELFSQFFENAEEIVMPILTYLSASNSGLITGIGALAALSSASRATKNLVKTINMIFGISSERTMIKKFLLSMLASMALTLAFILAMIIFLLLTIYGDPISVIVNFLFNYDLNQWTFWHLVKDILPVIYLFIFLTFVYRFVPRFSKHNRISFMEAMIGAGFSSLGWTVISRGYSLYVENMNRNNIMYGTLGTIMVMMLWFYLIILVLLIGAAVIEAYREVFDGEEDQ